MWVAGMINQFSHAKTFELIIDVVLIVAVMLATVILTKVRPAND